MKLLQLWAVRVRLKNKFQNSNFTIVYHHYWSWRLTLQKLIILFSFIRLVVKIFDGLEKKKP